MKLKTPSKTKNILRENLCKFLTFIKILLNSKVYFRDLISQFEFINVIIKSFETKDAIISYTASTVIKSFIAYCLSPQDKIEKKNRTLLLGPTHDFLNVLLRKL